MGKERFLPGDGNGPRREDEHGCPRLQGVPVGESRDEETPETQ